MADGGAGSLGCCGGNCSWARADRVAERTTNIIVDALIPRMDGLLQEFESRRDCHSLLRRRGDKEETSGQKKHPRSRIESAHDTLIDAPSENAFGAIPREVMKPSDYAEYMRVNVRKVHSWIKKGMPHFMLEGRVRIGVGEADSWLESRGHDKPSAR